ncbi:molybdopterin-guanine dinucleotide biosynthesis protein A [Agromyces cerinus]|uniref:molybdenum cofactor guanylyltransferase n=1 Tax=Agromyces cerinus TaxID=33878 RepID=UPI0027DAF090|nr:NTP transferase domain-containing protein [Agromyces cerinus]MBM7829830.1 molybdopterin-guanine dinucleotide biosynthesis protein A [Agromyces cerinus]
MSTADDMNTSSPSPAVRYDAIILAGGRASRLGGVQKAEVEVGGHALLDTALEAAARSNRIVVVGPEELRRERGRDTSARYVGEDPPFGGPVAGIAAGLSALGDFASAPVWLLVLACDLPFAPRAVGLLEHALIEIDAEIDAEADGEADGVCLVDADGREQWLAGIYHRTSLRHRVDGLAGGVHGASVRKLVDGLDLRHVFDDGAAFDVDTWQDVEEARRSAKELP